MTEEQKCSRCGTETPASAPGGHCLRCLFQLGLEADIRPEIPATENSGDRIGAFRLLEQIGEGGCGVVYLAEQEWPVRRRVAVKIIKLGMDTKQVIARFEGERQALSMMDHQNVAKVLDVGATEKGRPYFVMELIQGTAITDYCDKKGLTLRERLELFFQVCKAVQHAHQKGIIHRDLKPSNILITEQGGMAIPKVIDFGIAKATNEQRLTDKTIFTAFEQFIGTPAYMSPEQASLGRLDVDARSDIYSMGVLLFELITSKRPFEPDDASDVLQKIREVRPPRPGAWNHLVDRDLEVICLKCLEKLPEDRFGNVEMLADEIDRWLRQLPIKSRPVSLANRFRKWHRREPVIARFATGIVLTITLAAVCSTWLAVKARRATMQTGLLNIKLKLQIAEDDFANDDASAGISYLADILRGDPANRVAAERLVSALSLRNFCVPYGFLSLTDGLVKEAHFSPDGEWAAIGGGNAVSIANAKTGKLLAGPIKCDAPVRGVQFSKDSKKLVVAAGNSVGIFDLKNVGRRQWFDLGRNLSGAYFVDDGGKILATGSTSDVWLINIDSGAAHFKEFKTGGRLFHVAISADGAFAALPCEDGSVLVLDCRTGMIIRQSIMHQGGANSCDFSKDGFFLLTAGNDGVARILNLKTGLEKSTVFPQGSHILHAKFSPDGTRVATAATDRTAVIWDARTGRKICGPLKHLRTVYFVEFSPDGNSLLTCSLDRTARIWNAETGHAMSEPLQCSDEVREAEFSPDGKTILTRAIETNAILWRIQPPEQFEQNFHLPCRAIRAVISDSGTQVAVVGFDNCVRLWEPAANSTSYMTLPHSNGVTAAAFLPAGSQLVTGSSDGTVYFWDAKTGSLLNRKQFHPTEITILNFSRDSRWMFSGSYSKDAKVTELATGKTVLNLTNDTVFRFGDFSPDDRLLATITADRCAWIWELSTGRLLQGPLKHVNTLVSIGFSADGKSVRTYSGNQASQDWDVLTGKEIGEAGMPAVGIESQDRDRNRTRSLVIQDDSVFLRDPVSGRLLAEPVRHQAPMDLAAISPDGRILLAASADGNVSLRIIPHIPLPVPKWLPGFAESLTGRRLGKSETLELMNERNLIIPKGVRSDPDSDPGWNQWVQGILAESNHIQLDGLNTYWPAATADIR